MRRRIGPRPIPHSVPPCAGADPAGKRGFTLAEIVASIALIAVVGVFLVQMFAASDTLSAKARSLDCAVTVCASVADRWKSGTEPDGFDRIPEIAGSIEGGTNWRYLPVDRRMVPCAEAEAAYMMELVLTDDGDGVYNLQIRVVEADNGWNTELPAENHVLHELQVSRYFG
ncbi:MAG: prepilin-type N-terminal cleavage/methylation domain-containing protein [Clostridia bacterium]|nr:prepilin-type N-terminal cleavage/methylation domain-containing protein [Clostridia bacterium]